MFAFRPPVTGTETVLYGDPMRALSVSPATCCFIAALVLSMSAIAPAEIAAIGLSTIGADRFDGDLPDSFPAQSGDSFGWSFASGDFNGDGADDLATGVPLDDGLSGSEIEEAGLVVIRSGVPGGGLGDQVFGLTQVFAGEPEAADLFGFALAACDFDGDSFDDLAVGVPGEDLGAVEDAGAVFVFYGSEDGFSELGIQFLTQDSPGVPDSAEENDDFGFALACGDFDADGPDDLAVGAPGETEVGGAISAGAAFVFPGSPTGLGVTPAIRLDQDTPFVADGCETLDQLGQALGVADWNGDSFDDLAVGVPGENALAGAVHILFGSAGGITPVGSIFRDESGIGGASEPGDFFASVLAAGDFDGDAHADLAIGVPYEDFGAGNSIVDCGQVNVLYGAAAGFNFARNQFWAQDNLFGSSESNDLFGGALAAGDFDGDGHDELVIGSPGEDHFAPAAGIAMVIGGASSGLSDARFRVIAAGRDGFPGDATEGGGNFSFALAAGDFDGNGYADLALGAPFEDEGGLPDVGAVTVLYGSLFSDGFERGISLWSDVEGQP